MAVPKDTVFAMLKECHIVYRERGAHIFLSRNNRDYAILRKIDGPYGEYKIKEIRHVVSQLRIEKEIARKHIRDF